MRDILDLERWPLDDLGAVAGQALVARCREELRDAGILGVDAIIRPEALERVVAEVAPVLDTAAKLRQVFDATSRSRGVYFFDEFDAIGSQRGMANDVGEIRRVLNSFLQMIEQDRSHSLVVAATNHGSILDSALFRRFHDVLQYELPDKRQIVKLLMVRLAHL